MPAIERTGSILMAAAVVGLVGIASCGSQKDPAASQSVSSDHPRLCPVQVTPMDAHAPGPSKDAIAAATCPSMPAAPVVSAAILDVPAPTNSCQRMERARRLLDSELAHARYLITTLEHANAELRRSLALEREQLDQMRRRLMYGRGIALQ